jgi:hypothetical protein
MMQLLLNKRIKVVHKVLIFLLLGFTFYALFPFLMQRVGFVDTESIISQIEDLETRKSQGETTIDMSGENLLVKWVSYLFRPFFYDAKNFLSIVSSLENVVWVLIFIKIFKNFRRSIINSYRNIYWFSLFSIFTITVPGAYLLYNLGIAVRQKTMVVPFLFVVFFLTLYKSSIKEIN